MFSQVFLCWQGGLPSEGGRQTPSEGRAPPPPAPRDTDNRWVVRILLECILVLNCVCHSLRGRGHNSLSGPGLSRILHRIGRLGGEGRYQHMILSNFPKRSLKSHRQSFTSKCQVSVERRVLEWRRVIFRYTGMVTPNCSTPHRVPNAERSPAIGPYPVNSVVVFTCNSGYVLQGSPVLICRANGQWSDSTPLCLTNGKDFKPLHCHLQTKLREGNAFRSVCHSVYVCICMCVCALVDLKGGALQILSISCSFQEI